MTRNIVILIVILAILVAIGGVALYNTLKGAALEGDGRMDASANGGDGPAGSPELHRVGVNASLESFSWSQTESNTQGCFSFSIAESEEGQGLCFSCDYFEGAEEITVKDVPIEEGQGEKYLKKIGDALIKASPDVYRSPDPDETDAAVSIIKAEWLEGGKTYINRHNGEGQDALYDLLVEISQEFRGE